MLKRIFFLFSYAIGACVVHAGERIASDPHPRCLDKDLNSSDLATQDSESQAGDSSFRDDKLLKEVAIPTVEKATNTEPPTIPTVEKATNTELPTIPPIPSSPGDDNGSVVSVNVGSAQPIVVPPGATVIIVNPVSVPAVQNNVAPVTLKAAAVSVQPFPVASSAPGILVQRSAPVTQQNVSAINFNDTFINILADEENILRRGAGSFSCVTKPVRSGIPYSLFAPKLPIFCGKTLSHATSNVPIESLFAKTTSNIPTPASKKQDLHRRCGIFY